jgi:O-antigen/teichoic acid export membrane protein
LKRRLAWAYVLQFYVAIISIFLMPVYLHRLGAEAFGLVGFFLMAQTWMQILDIGLTPALSREMSRLRAGTISLDAAASRLNALEWVQGALAITVIMLIWSTNDDIAKRWLSAQALSGDTVATCVAWMGVAISLRWLAGLYRGVLVGLEQQQQANVLAATFATLRFVAVVPLLLYVTTAPEDFFAFQMLVSAIELAASAWLAHHHIPTTGIFRSPDIRALQGMLPLVGSMAFLGAMWVTLTQIDKLVLSGILNLRDYGHFTLAVMAASGILILTPPLHQVIQPRLTILYERGERESLVSLYRLLSQLSVVGFVGLGTGIGFFAGSILRIWTGSESVAMAAAPILLWYGLANAVVGMLVMPFMLQFAKGNLRLHVYGNLLMLAMLVPALVMAAQQRGAIGAGQVFFVANSLFLLLWVPLVHRRFLPEVTWREMFSDTMSVAFVVAGILGMAARLLPTGLPAVATLVWCCGAMLLALSSGLLAGRHTRRALFDLLAPGRK